MQRRSLMAYNEAENLSYTNCRCSRPTRGAATGLSSPSRWLIGLAISDVHARHKVGNDESMILSFGIIQSVHSVRQVLTGHTSFRSSARGGHGGHGGWSGGRHFSGFRGGFGYRSFAYPYYTTGSCWRWQATPYGPRRVWVCGAYGYSYY